MLENFGIFNGDEKMSTTTGSKTVNAYVEKGKEDVYYWFGSDTYGRDIWTRTWEGARVSLIIAVAAAIIDMVIGMSYGLISGYFGGKVDMMMQRFLKLPTASPSGDRHAASAGAQTRHDHHYLCPDAHRVGGHEPHCPR